MALGRVCGANENREKGCRRIFFMAFEAKEIWLRVTIAAGVCVFKSF
jgi:hypothetical protein